MNKKILIALAVIFTVLSSVNLVLAGSLSIASITIPSTANQGDSFTLSASVSGSSATSVSGTLSLPSGVTCTPTSSQSISLSSSGTGTASWSCKGDVAGDYTNKITVNLAGTDSGTGGSLSASQQTGLKVLSPASLATSSTTKSGSVIFTVGVNNAGDVATTYTVGTSCGSATCTAPSGTQSISGNAVASHDVTVSGSAGTYTATATITGANGQTLTTSQSVTISAAQAAAGAEAAAGAAGNATTPGVKVTVQKGNATITIPSIAAGKSAVVNINKTEDVAFRFISITVKNSVNNIQITVTKLADKPATITQSVTGKVYHYVQVDKNISDTAVNQTAIRFEVEKSWISANNINKSTISLQRYENSTWNKLQTTLMSEDSTSVLYEAISPGLSVFAISGEAVAAAPTEQPPAEKPAEEKKEAPALIPTKGRGLLITVIVVIVVVAGVVFFLVKKNVIKLGTLIPQKSTGWEDLKKKYKR